MIDYVEVLVRAGDGGEGAISFRREKFVPFGGPDGGDGGDGGDVIVRADPSVDSLRAFRPRHLYRADDGGNGQGKKKYGERGKDRVLHVPVGTVVSVAGIGAGTPVVSDLAALGEEVVVARGGRGGRGNTRYATSINQAPRLAQTGSAGEQGSVVLELRLIADVGIIGYPNVGKSTLLAAASEARPRIAAYPFTTLEPVLGTVSVDSGSFVLAEIPGLIEGAHLGRGLGHDFLRHAMRTRMFIHLVDGASTSPVEDMVHVNTELALFDAVLARRPQLLVINKIDVPEIQVRLPELREAFRAAGMRPHFISAGTGEGVGDLMAQVWKRLESMKAEAMPAEEPLKVFRPLPRRRRTPVERQGEVWRVLAPDLERIAARVDLASGEVRGQLLHYLDRVGVNRALEAAGAAPGDRARCGEFEWTWQPVR